MRLVLKIAVSGTLIALLLWQLDWASFRQLFPALDPRLTSLAVVLLTLQYPISAWKWKKALQAHNLDFPFMYLLRALCIGFFFNNFLPTSIGGDAYRAYRTIEPGGSKIRPISAIVLERVLGILALLVIGGICTVILILEGDLEHPEIISVVLATVTLACVAALAAWYSSPMRRFRARLLSNQKLQPLFQNLRTLAAHPTELMATVALSFLFQIVAVAVIAVLFAALGLGSLFVESGFVALASGVAGILPISINGIGVMEGSFAVAALEARIPFDEAVFAALFLRFYMLVFSVACGVLYALEPARASKIAGNLE